MSVISGFPRLAACLLLALCCPLVLAQSDEIEESFKPHTPAEIAEFRAILAEPVPQNALNSSLQEHFRKKELAAEKLGEPDAIVAMFRQWAAVFPNGISWNNFANELMRVGAYDEAFSIRRISIEKENLPNQREMYRTNYARDLYSLGRYEEAQQMLDLIFQNIETLKKGPATFSNKGGNQSQRNTMYLWRLRAGADALASSMQLRLGKLDEAVTYAAQAVNDAREDVRLAQTLGNGQNELLRASTTLGNSLAQKNAALQAAGKYGEAEETLKEYLRLSRDLPLRPRLLSSIYSAAGGLRHDQREFVQAENYYRKADKVLESLAYAPTTQARTNLVRALVASLEGQHRWDAAVAELDRLDGAVKHDAVAKRRTQYPLERGYAYFESGKRLPQAVELFQSLLQDMQSRYPANHFFVAQASGLQGVALWRTGTAGSKACAIPLLQSAVRSYMLPDNFDMETVGVRKDIRELIFAAYLDALFTTPGANPMDAMGPADWVRGGMVQEALADAAVRSAATDPALASLVRQDQDGRNEIEALRKYLAGDAGSAQSPLPEVALKMRARIAELDIARKKLQTEIKSRFPGYDRLVRPTPPGLTELAKELVADEALIMLLPTEDAVYVWALSSAGKSAYARVDLSKVQLARLVKNARNTLDFNEMDGMLLPFNAAASSELYQRLLVPVKGVIEGKKHLVVAAGGALGQMPFGVLLTQPVRLVTMDAPWLIRQAAITHIPSLSAWMAVKQFSKAHSASEPLAAWGDPQFGSVKQLASAGNGTRHIGLTRSVALGDVGDGAKDDAQGALDYASIPALPETRDELLSIATVLKADHQRDLHLGAQATKASVLKSNQEGELIKKRVIAFATHGLMAGDLPNLTQPALALASTGNEAREPLGALLTLDEVLGLKLNADWVILSACNTAASDGKAEEALSGLARGFFYAGSRSLLVTHWAVESESAKQLTTATLAHYVENPSERKAESLRQAMLRVMAEPKYAHPAFWAPYALVGDGGR
ncbi:CHAT domain-containing protein [Herbaspirillum sp. RTI4]|uniref:CHAT domain-containing protein n=1 Tax=Herbaspirillum sp. RTI4 TaxID=3048640 RepID=UPI002AB42A7B|nr:CHAT domain-containing protein [Herbaspirillum sp. RTI4]MDY7577808.1 CHAT domain-containing protein [Herbaspirillum sp. RTI4]MEA9983440.1 CHAT domain-containing protein [Herbaspirillum sp. RTI4]